MLVHHNFTFFAPSTVAAFSLPAGGRQVNVTRITYTRLRLLKSLTVGAAEAIVASCNSWTNLLTKAKVEGG